MEVERTSYRWANQTIGHVLEASRLLLRMGLYQQAQDILAQALGVVACHPPRAADDCTGFCGVGEAQPHATLGSTKQSGLMNTNQPSPLLDPRVTAQAPAGREPHTQGGDAGEVMPQREDSSHVPADGQVMVAGVLRALEQLWDTSTSHSQAAAAVALQMAYCAHNHRLTCVLPTAAA